MKWRILLGIVLALLLVSVGGYVWLVASLTPEPLAIGDLMPLLPQSPREATFDIDGEEITLLDGRFERESAPGSATQDVYALWGEAVRGDANADGSDDALLWLTYNGGGSGTFYYLAVAVWDSVGYRGSNTVPLGDRITPVSLDLWYDIVRVTYRTHAEGQALAEPPIEKVTRYFMVQGAQIIELGPLTEDELVVTGRMVLTDGEAQITPCGATPAIVDSSSRALPALEAMYRARTSGMATGTPVFVVVAGSYGTSVQGEGEHSVPSLTVGSVLGAPEDGSCDTHLESDEQTDADNTSPGGEAQVVDNLSSTGTPQGTN